MINTIMIISELQIRKQQSCIISHTKNMVTTLETLRHINMQFLYTIIISDKQAQDRTLQHEDRNERMNLFLTVYFF